MTLRGFTADMTILDEANYIQGDIINSVIRPTTITRTDSRLVMISTPGIKKHPFYDAITKPELGFKTYTWPTSMNPKASKEQLDLERRTIGEYAYNKEYNAQFLDEESAYFPSNLVLSCTEDYELNPKLDPPKRLVGQFYIGIDLGKHADHSTIIILNKISNNPQIRLIYMHEFQLETPYNDVIQWIKHLRTIYRFTSGCLDQTGVGELPYENIKQFMPNIKGLTLTAQTKTTLMTELRLAMENHQLIIPQNTHLLSQITSQQCKPSNSGQLLFTHPPQSHDDLLWALALANHATLEKTIDLEAFKGSWKIFPD